MGEISKLPGNEKWSVSGITTAMLPSPGAELDSHLTEKSRAECVSVCVYVCWSVSLFLHLSVFHIEAYMCGMWLYSEEQREKYQWCLKLSTDKMSVSE